MSPIERIKAAIELQLTIKEFFVFELIASGEIALLDQTVGSSYYMRNDISPEYRILNSLTEKGYIQLAGGCSKTPHYCNYIVTEKGEEIWKEHNGDSLFEQIFENYPMYVMIGQNAYYAKTQNSFDEYHAMFKRCKLPIEKQQDVLRIINQYKNTQLLNMKLNTFIESRHWTAILQHESETKNPLESMPVINWDKEL